mgnify:CR=1 FL=1
MPTFKKNTSKFQMKRGANSPFDFGVPLMGAIGPAGAMMRNRNQMSPYRKDDKNVAHNPNARDPEDGANVNPSTINKNVQAPLQQTYSEKKTKRNIFGREREVTKYFDKETGKKVGKQVNVTKKDGSTKTKTKATTPGRLRKRKVKDDFFAEKRNPNTGNQTMTSHERVTTAQNKPELKEFVKEPKKNPRLATYKQAWDDGRFTVAEGKRTDKFGNTYSDDTAGYQGFVDASEKWWEGQKKTKQSAMKKYKYKK